MHENNCILQNFPLIRTREFSTLTPSMALICQVHSVGNLLKWEGNSHKAETLTGFGLIWCLENTLHFHMLHNVGRTETIPREEVKIHFIDFNKLWTLSELFSFHVVSPQIDSFLC